jgi:hypothetical protein
MEFPLFFFGRLFRKMFRSFSYKYDDSDSEDDEQESNLSMPIRVTIIYV